MAADTQVCVAVFYEKTIRLRKWNSGVVKPNFWYTEYHFMNILACVGFQWEAYQNSIVASKQAYSSVLRSLSVTTLGCAAAKANDNT